MGTARLGTTRLGTEARMGTNTMLDLSAGQPTERTQLYMTNASSTPFSAAPDTDGLPAGVAIHPDSLDLTHEPVPEAAVASGTPSTGLHELGSFGGVDLGVWEMSEGGMFDTEAEEVFVVLSGAATVEFLAADGSVSATHELTPHTLMRLAAGTRTRWTVTSTLRKVYLTAS